MNHLREKECEACRVGATLLTVKEQEKYLEVIPKWEVFVEDAIAKLKRDFSFKNFKEALKFTNDIGLIAEAEGHHPDITTRYGSVTIVWYTHKIEGLHLNDFIMAAKTDHLAKQ